MKVLNTLCNIGTASAIAVAVTLGHILEDALPVLATEISVVHVGLIKSIIAHSKPSIHSTTPLEFLQ